MRSTSDYVWGSQSAYDNNEGFDYTVQSGEGGDYELILTWPQGATSCEGTQSEALGVAIALIQ